MKDVCFLRLYFIPSPGGMDWTSPSSLLRTVLKNRLSMRSRFLGHVFVEVRSGSTREITGMAGKKFDYFRQLVIEKKGLGVLYHSFEGKLEHHEDIDREIKLLSRSGERLNFITFRLNRGNADRLIAYLEAYKEQNVGRFYGLANRPLHREGSGCSAFGASFLEVAGILESHYRDAWAHSVNIPLEFAGRPLKDDRIHPLRVLLSARRWAHDHEPHQKLFFWEPDRMFRWVKYKLIRADEHDMQVVQLGRALGLVVDKTHITAPGGPLFLKDQGTRVA
jgi:hypothetical protein